MFVTWLGGAVNVWSRPASPNTTIVRGMGDTAGIAVVEVYALN